MYESVTATRPSSPKKSLGKGPFQFGTERSSGGDNLARPSLLISWGGGVGAHPSLDQSSTPKCLPTCPLPLYHPCPCRSLLFPALKLTPAPSLTWAQPSVFLGLSLLTFLLDNSNSLLLPTCPPCQLAEPSFGNIYLIRSSDYLQIKNSPHCL